MSALLIPVLPTPPPAPPEVVQLDRRSFGLPEALVFSLPPKRTLWQKLRASLK